MNSTVPQEYDEELQEKRRIWKIEQARLRGLLRMYDDFPFKGMPSFVGGVGILLHSKCVMHYPFTFEDISFYKNTNKAIACLVVLRYPSLEKVAELFLPCIMTEPYMPGFLAFR